MDILNIPALPTMLPPDTLRPVKLCMYSNEEWAEHRDFIAGVYLLEGIANKNIVAVLRENCGFLVT